MKHRLMIKEHAVTKMRYLCYSRREDYNTYLGSGTYWKRHLAKHGRNITTTVIGEYDTYDELVHYGLYYSDLYDVVASTSWANLRPEAGDGTPMGTTWIVSDTTRMGETY